MTVGGGDPAAFAGTSRFQILRLLGQGGVGVVFEALDREQKAHVALKTLRVVSPEALLRFKREFRALQDLDHPNLVRLGELIEEAGSWFFTMDLVEGTDLLSFVRLASLDRRDPADVATQGPLPSAAGSFAPASLGPTLSPAPTLSPPPTATLTLAPPRSGRGVADLYTGETMGTGAAPAPERLAQPGLRLYSETRLRHAFAQLAEGLDALHRARLVHRDVKPSNVLVTRDGRVVILDFGLATEVADVSDEGVMGMGTIAFMAPEQWEGAVPQPASDWYAVGVALYLALTGSLPFGGKTRTELAAKKLHAQPPPPHTLCADIPPDLEELCLALLRRDPAARPGGAEIVRRLREAPASGGSSPAGAVKTAASTFLGREAELTALSCALADARHGTVAVLVTGESGMGKSTLVRRFRELAVQEDDVLVLAGRCHERESVPYKAVDGIVDALSRHLRRLPTAEVVALLPAGIGALSQVFPVLRQVQAIASRATAEPLAERMELRRHVFGALRDLFARVGERWRLVVLIDDLQWADSDSMALLAQVLRPPGPRLLLVATQRGPAASTVSLGEREPRHIHIGALPTGQALELAMRYLGEVGAARPELAEAIAREAAGHPLFIAELVRHLADGAEGAAAAPTPLRLDDALRLRIARLDDETRRVLELVAVASVPLAQSFLAEVLDLPFAELVRHVATLRAGRLLRTAGARPADRAEPYHDRISESLRAGLPAEVARAWHLRLARALEPLPGSSPELLSTHWAGAGELRRAAEHAIVAAEEAGKALAFERSARLHRRALELFEALADAPATHRSLVRLAGALVSAGRSREAAEVYARAAEHAPAAEAIDLRRRSGEAFLVSGRVDEGMATMTALLEHIGMPLPRSRAGTLASIAMSRAKLRLRGLDSQVVEEAEVAPARLLKLDIAWAATMGLAFVDIIQSACLQQRFLRLALRTGERRRLMRGLVCEAILVSSQGSRTVARADEIVARIRALGAPLDGPYERGWIACIGALCAHHQGRCATVVSLAEAAVLDLERAGSSSSWELDTLRVMLVTYLFWTGRTREMVERSEQFVRAARDRGDHYESTLLRTGIPSYAWLVRGDAAAARLMAEDAIAGWSKRGTIVHTLMDLTARTAIDLYDDPEADAAWRRVNDGWPALRKAFLLDYQVGRVGCLELRGRAAVAAARRAPPARARSLLRAAERDARAVAREGSPTAGPLATVIDAAVQHQRGDAEAAVRSLRQAAAGFEASSLALHAAVARRRLGELLGGDEGAALVAAADAWMRTEAIADPARLTAMMAPGFSR
jgi:tetratricopeptide (TPR) repeat protein